MTSFKRKRWQIGARLAAALVAAALFVALDVSDALAQSSSCGQLFASLRALNRNGDFLNADQANADVRALQADERDAESAYVSAGCQSAQRQGYPQPPECRALGRQILQQRAQLQQMSRGLANGNAVAQQREQVLQEIARFGCSQQGSRPSFAGAGQPPPRHRNFLQDLFGGFESRPQPQDPGVDNYGDSGAYGGQEQVQDPYANEQGGNTIRTVCVRLSDGYYWPISYATVRDYIPQDAQTCLAECPGQQVDLYFYDNPGQEPEQMVNAQGTPYTSLPTAFAYRKQVDLTNNTCKPQVTFGQIALQDTGGGQTRAMVSFDGQNFPLPLRDPRSTQRTATVQRSAVAAIDIPLPRPRPASPGTAASAPVAPVPQPVVSAADRIVKIGDKTVRIVGPDTPYAPATTTGGTSG